MSRQAWKSSLLDKADIDHVLAHTAPIWGSFAYGNFFITGGTGFVGKWLLEMLLTANLQHNLNIDVTILTRDAGKFQKDAPHIAGQENVQMLEGDIRNCAFPEDKFTHIIHAATDMTAEADMYDVIVNGTQRVADFAAASKIKNLLFISSGAIYGKQPADMPHLDEDFPAAPHTAYGQGKLAAEKLMTDYTIARLFAVTGPYLKLDGSYAAGNFVRDAFAGGPIRITGDGTPLRSYLYAADMAIWLWTILARGQRGAAYNVGSEEAISIVDLAHRIAEQTGCTVAGGNSGVGGPERYIPSTTKARAELGLEQYITLNEGLRRMIAWNRARL